MLKLKSTLIRVLLLYQYIMLLAYVNADIIAFLIYCHFIAEKDA